MAALAEKLKQNLLDKQEANARARASAAEERRQELADSVRAFFAEARKSIETGIMSGKCGPELEVHLGRMGRLGLEGCECTKPIQHHLAYFAIRTGGLSPLINWDATSPESYSAVKPEWTAFQQWAYDQGLNVKFQERSEPGEDPWLVLTVQIQRYESA